MGRSRTTRTSSAPGDQSGVTLSKEIDGEPRTVTTQSAREANQLRAEGWRAGEAEDAPAPDADGQQ